MFKYHKVVVAVQCVVTLALFIVILLVQLLTAGHYSSYNVHVVLYVYYITILYIKILMFTLHLFIYMLMSNYEGSISCTSQCNGVPEVNSKRIVLKSENGKSARIPGLSSDRTHFRKLVTPLLS